METDPSTKPNWLAVDIFAVLKRAGADDNATDLADAIDSWLRSPEGRAVVARALGLLTVRQSEWHVSNQEDNAYAAGRREAAGLIADVLSVDGDPAAVLADAREYARSFTEESSDE